MIASCPTVPTGPGFLSGLLTSLDCLSLGVAQKSFAFLGSSGGPGSVILLAAVALLIVIFGYRMLFGPQPDIGDATSAALKVGIALALVSSWPAVSRVIAGPLLNGPAELTAWAGPGLTARLGNVDGGIAAVTSWGTGRDDIRASRTAEGEFTANSAATVPVADSIAYSGARLSFLLTAIGSIGLIKLLSGILVGFAPIFAGLLLFDRTRGLFAGWARTLFALLIAGAALRVILSLELALLEPWLAEVVRQRQAFQSAPSSALELLAMTSAFGLIGAGVLLLIARFSLSLEMPLLRVGSSEGSRPTAEREAKLELRTANHSASAASGDRLVRMVGGMERLDAMRETMRVLGRETRGSVMGNSSTTHHHSGWNTTRPRSGRRSLLAGRRDLKAQTK